MSARASRLHEEFLAAERHLKEVCNQWVQFGIEHGECAKSLARTPGNQGHEIFAAIAPAKERLAKVSAESATCIAA